MAKFKLIQNPTFKADVMLPTVGGDPVKVQFEFKYRDRAELAALYAGWGARHKAWVNNPKRRDWRNSPPC